MIILIVVLLGCAISLFGGGSESNSYTPVSAEVEAYDPLIQEYARQHGIPEYVELIKAVMMQESGGQGNDPMQASECGYNTQYPNTPNGITDPEYSINVGIQNLAACLNAAEVENPVDMDRIKLALQGYNLEMAIFHGRRPITAATLMPMRLNFLRCRQNDWDGTATAIPNMFLMYCAIIPSDGHLPAVVIRQSWKLP